MHVHYTFAKAEIHDMEVLCDADETSKDWMGVACSLSRLQWLLMK